MEDHRDQDIVKRDQWRGKLDFLLSCVGFSVGLGNIWRFPYLCYKNGGGSFLIPYFLFLICGGIPIFMLEISLGQYMSLGGLGAWNICPAMKGIGYATLIISCLMNIYYIVVLAWDVTYMAASFSTVLPYSHCNNWWNTARCFVNTGMLNSSGTSNANTSRSVFGDENLSLNNQTNVTLVSPVDNTDPVVEFWERRVLQISDSIDEPGGLVWELAIALLIVWVLCYFCVFKGVKWSGKIVYFTATFPYVMLISLLIRAVTLDGAAIGLAYLFYPDFNKLTNAQVWLDAGTQIFFSYAIGLGAMVALGSYNTFHKNFYRDCIVISSINSGTSLMSGLVIFSVLGFMANQQGVGIDQVAQSGPGLAFIAYPKAVTQMPLAPFWAFLFFFMILLVGLGSQFVGVEGVMTMVVDLFPNLRKGHRREVTMAIYCTFSFLIGLPMVSHGGIYVFQLFDYFAVSGMALLWICLAECLAIGWLFGVNRYYDCLEMMLGFRINIWLKLCWKVLSPLLITIISIWMWAQFSFPKYNNEYEYPVWAKCFGLGLAFSSMICIPLHFIFSLMAATGPTLQQKWKTITTPIVKPERIPLHWPELEDLHQHYYDNDRSSQAIKLRCFTKKKNSHASDPVIKYKKAESMP